MQARTNVAQHWKHHLLPQNLFVRRLSSNIHLPHQLAFPRSEGFFHTPLFHWLVKPGRMARIPDVEFHTTPPYYNFDVRSKSRGIGGTFDVKSEMNPKAVIGRKTTSSRIKNPTFIGISPNPIDIRSPASSSLRPTMAAIALA